jgi:multicomponent Na+:H+ antiporter subunit D
VAIGHTTVESLLYGASATILAVVLAFVGLYRRRLPRLVSMTARRTLAPPIHVLRVLHSGVVGDYVTWVAVGTAVVGGTFALLLHS